MAIPRVFVSSTCYDLKYIRENLKYFIRTIGYEPVLSDDGDVFYNPSVHTHESCLREVETCQIFVLIIGGRYGGIFKDSGTSITNNEYKQAIKSNIPVFALVENLVHSDHHLYGTNKKERPEIFDQIKYPNCDHIKIFDFLDEVRRSVNNNSLFAFRDFSDIESYLKKQWAGMMFDFLDQRQRDNHAKITNRLLDDLTVATRKSEELIKILLKSSQHEDADATIKMVDTKVEAENFARQVLSRFSIENLPLTKFEDLEKIPLNQNWEDFLRATKDFYEDSVETEDGQTDIVLWGPNFSGLAVAVKTEDGIRKRIFFHDLDKSFGALKNADKSTLNTVFKMLIHGVGSA